MRQGYIMADWCCVCRGSGKTVDHLLLHCPNAAGLWHFVFQSLGWVISACVKDLLFSWRNWLGKHSSSVWNLVPACLMWTIWKERNRRFFENLECSDNQILETFVTTLFQWSRIWAFTSCTSIVSFITTVDSAYTLIPL